MLDSPTSLSEPTLQQIIPATELLVVNGFDQHISLREVWAMLSINSGQLGEMRECCLCVMPLLCQNLLAVFSPFVSAFQFSLSLGECFPQNRQNNNCISATEQSPSCFEDLDQLVTKLLKSLLLYNWNYKPVHKTLSIVRRHAIYLLVVSVQFT